MANKIDLSIFNGKWKIQNNPSNSSEIIWSNGEFIMSYSNNIFGKYGQGWIVKKSIGQNKYEQYFAVKTNGSPWDEDRQIIYSNILVDVPENNNIEIIEEQSILYNDLFQVSSISESYYDYSYKCECTIKIPHDYTFLIRIAHMSSNENDYFRCQIIPNNIKVLKIINNVKESLGYNYDESYQEIDLSKYTFPDNLQDGIYLFGHFQKNISNGQLDFLLYYNRQIYDENGVYTRSFSIKSNFIINYEFYNCLCFQLQQLTNNENFSFGLTNNYNDVFYFIYKDDLHTSLQIDWNKYDGENISLKQGDKLLLYSNCQQNQYKFNTEGGKLNLYGNINSLFNQKNNNFNLSEMFAGCTNLYDASMLDLSSILLSQKCFYQMFANCTSLIKAPILSFMQLKENCYEDMFRGCISLTEAPILPAKTLVDYCYANMFNGCTSLNSIEVGFVTWHETATENWVYNVANEGIFIKPINLQEITGYSHIPENWVIQSHNEFEIVLISEEQCLLSLSFYDPSYNSNQKMFYKTNYHNWKQYNSGEQLSLKLKNDFVLFKSQNKTLRYFKLKIEKSKSKIIARGDISSLLNYSTQINDSCYQNMFENCVNLYDVSNLKLLAETLKPSCYYYMFRNCTSLISPPELPATTLASSCYEGMFSGCTLLTEAPVLKAETLATSCYRNMFEGCTSLTEAPALKAQALGHRCYEGMFRGCTSLENAPELPATTLVSYCYYYMFYGCASLISVPELKATVLDEYCCAEMFSGCASLENIPKILLATELRRYCYYGMFRGCTSLTTAPELPAKTLVENCYQSMFYKCEKLNYIKIGLTNWNNYECLRWWLSGVAQEGTFVKPVQLPDYYGHQYYIPYDWKLINIVTDNKPLTFTALSDDSSLRIIYVEKKELTDMSFNYSCQFSPNGGETWNNNDYVISKESKFIKMQRNQEISFANINAIWNEYFEYGYLKFQITGSFKVSGKLSSLNGFSNLLIKNNFYRLFKDCVGLRDASQLEFLQTLQQSCYEQMFMGCTSLIKAPKLPAKTLKSSCYKNMFNGCTKLTTAPALPAKTLTTSCYEGMFNGCNLLNYIQAMFGSWEDGNHTLNWVKDVNFEGTFKKIISLSLIQGNSFIPFDWVIENIITGEIILKESIINIEAFQCKTEINIDLSLYFQAKTQEEVIIVSKNLPNGLKIENNIISGIIKESGKITSIITLMGYGVETKYLQINWNISDAQLPINISGLESKILINSSMLLSGFTGIVQINQQ